MNDLLDAAASTNDADESLEKTLDILRKIFISDSIDATPIGDSDKSTPSRTQYHDNIAILKESLFTNPTQLVSTLKPEYQNLRLVDVSSLSSSAKANTAVGYAYRYALLNLNTFAITGSNSLYDKTQLNGDNFSANYLADRAQFLALKITFNTTDSSVRGTDRLEFVDKTLNYVLSTDFVGSAPAKRFHFGSDGHDELEGGIREDHLYGAKGNDTLNGNAGNDYIHSWLASQAFTFGWERNSPVPA